MNVLLEYLNFEQRIVYMGLNYPSNSIICTLLLPGITMVWVTAGLL